MSHTVGKVGKAIRNTKNKDKREYETSAEPGQAHISE